MTESDDRREQRAQDILNKLFSPDKLGEAFEAALGNDKPYVHLSLFSDEYPDVKDTRAFADFLDDLSERTHDGKRPEVVEASGMTDFNHVVRVWTKPPTPISRVTAWIMKPRAESTINGAF